MGEPRIPDGLTSSALRRVAGPLGAWAAQSPTGTLFRVTRVPRVSPGGAERYLWSRDHRSPCHSRLWLGLAVPGGSLAAKLRPTPRGHS